MGLGGAEQAEEHTDANEESKAVESRPALSRDLTAVDAHMVQVDLEEEELKVQLMQLELEELELEESQLRKMEAEQEMLEHELKICHTVDYGDVPPRFDPCEKMRLPKVVAEGVPRPPATPCASFAPTPRPPVQSALLLSLCLPLRLGVEEFDTMPMQSAEIDEAYAEAAASERRHEIQMEETPQDAQGARERYQALHAKTLIMGEVSEAEQEA